MLKSTSKYRSFFFYILILSYVIGSFPFPLYEAIHFFAHVEASAHSDYQFHSYHKHGHSHEHLTLNILDQSKEDQKGEQLPKEFKKKIETTNAQDYSNLIAFECRADNFNTTFSFTASVMEQISPPPERI